MCCLKYENDEYETAKEQLPDIGSTVTNSSMVAVLVGLNILERINSSGTSRQRTDCRIYIG